MNYQWAKSICLVAALTLSFGLFPETLAAVDCTQSAIQAISPPNKIGRAHV